MAQEIKDITIIGGGPTGLFALFYAGMRGVTAQIVDALPEAGGQLTALYPEKYIFDVAGIPQVLAKDLVTIARRTGGALPAADPPDAARDRSGAGRRQFVLVTETDRFPTRAIVIAAGIGAFSPRRLPQRVRGAVVRARDLRRGDRSGAVSRSPRSDHRRRRLGLRLGDTSCSDRAAAVTLVHRSDRFRAHGATVAAVSRPRWRRAARSSTPSTSSHDIECRERWRAFLARASLRDIKAKTTRDIDGRRRPADARLRERHRARSPNGG